LDHPNIVAFLRSGEAGNFLFLEMEYVRGVESAQLVKDQGPLPPDLAVGLVSQLLSALQHVHDRSIVHRDVKPGNLLIQEGVAPPLAKLSDFGLARAYNDPGLGGPTLTGEFAGTPLYMAPEQCLGLQFAGPSVDQYGAAATLYFLLTAASHLERGRSVPEQFRLTLEGSPVPIRSRRPDLPQELAVIIHRGLEREPADRFPDVAAMNEALREWSRRRR
jgi:serine/threonine protein kinase